MVTQSHGWVGVLDIGIFLLSVCRCWRFVLDPIVVEASLTFAWCTCYLHGVKMVRSWGLMGFLVIFMVCGDSSSWYVEMVFSSWCVEMVSSWGLLEFLVKVWFMLSFGMLSLVWGWFYYYVMVYSWYAIKVVTCYSMFIWSMLSLWLRWLNHVVIFMFLRTWLELWHWSWFSFLVLITLIISWILHDIAMLNLELEWIDWLQVLMHT